MYQLANNGQYPDTYPAGNLAWVGRCTAGTTSCNGISLQGGGITMTFGSDLINDTIVEHPSNGLGYSLQQYMKLENIPVRPNFSTGSIGILYWRGIDSVYSSTKSTAEIVWIQESGHSQCPNTFTGPGVSYNWGMFDGYGGTWCEIDLPE
jgi:hypothetical protein